MKGYKKYLSEAIGGNESGKIGQEMTVSLNNVNEVYEDWNRLAADLTFKGRHDEEYLMDLAVGLETITENVEAFLKAVEKAKEYIHSLPMGE